MVHKQSESTSTKSLRSSKCINVPLIKKAKLKTYGKVTDKNLNVENYIQERNSDNDLWKDSFDRLLDSVSPIKRNKFVRASFNQDSSIDLSVPKENQLNKISHKDEKKNERSPFNMDKSLAAINHKMKKKPAATRKKQKNQKIKLSKNTQLDKLKGTVASTPLREKKVDHFLNSCIISPIKPKPRDIFPLFNSDDGNQKIILNYTDSIEEARNISILNNTNSNSKVLSKYIDKSLYENELQNNQQCSLVQYNQAGLELNSDGKMKYVLSYVNKLPSNYEKYNFSDATNINCISNKKLSRTLSLNGYIFRSNSQNSCCEDNSLLRICNKICNSNPIPKCYDDILIQPIQIDNALPNISFISLNSTIPNRETRNNNDKIPKLIGSSFQQNIENNTDIISTTNIVDNIKDLTSQLPNRLDNQLSIVDKNNRAFANKLIFLRNCQMLNASNNFPKRLSCLYHNNTKKKLLRRHTIQSIIKISYDPTNNLNSLSTKKCIEENTDFESVNFDRNCNDKFNQNKPISVEFSNGILCNSNETDKCYIINHDITDSESTKRIVKRRNENNCKKLSDHNSDIINSNVKNITTRRPQIMNKNKNNIISSINCLNSNSAMENACTNENIELDQHQQEKISISKINLNNEIKIMSPEIKLKRFDENCDISVITRNQKLTTTSTKISENCLDGNSIIDLSDNTTDTIITQNRKNLSKSLTDNNISSKHKKISFEEKQTEVDHTTEKELICSSMDRTLETITSHEDSEIIPGTPIVTLYRNTRSRKLLTTSKTVKNITSDVEVIKSIEGISNMKARKFQSVGNRKRQEKSLFDNNKFRSNKSKNCKIINNIDKITSETIGSDEDNEIIPGTPLTTVKPLIRNRILTTTSNKIVENSSDGNSIIDLSNDTTDIILTQNRKQLPISLLDDNNISSKHQKISFEEKQPKVDQTTEKELISSRMDRTIETIISHEDSQIIPATPIVTLYRNTRSRKLFTTSNVASEDEVIKSNEGISYTKATKLKSIGNRKRQGQILLDNNKLPNKQKKITSEDTEPTLSYQKDNFNAKKCKIILKNINDGIYKITSETKESDKFNEIIPETPLTTVKPLIRNGKLTTTSTKIVENSSGENSILNLCDRYQYLTQNREKITKSLLDDNNISSKHQKISFEEKQPKVDQTTGISYTKATKLKSIGNRKRQGQILLDNNKLPNKQKKITSEDTEPTLSYQKDNFNSKKCKIILKNINDGIYKITSETKESDKFNEIIPETPLTTVKPLIRNGKLTTTSTKIVENSSGENSILNLCDRYQYLTQNREKITKSLLDDNNISSKHQKISFEEKQPKVDQTTEKELISSRMDRTIETIISHEESEIKPGTPISLYRKTRSRKLFTKSKTVENFTSKDEVINSNEGISYTKATKLKSIGNRKRRGQFLLDNNKFPNKEKKITTEDKEPTLSYQKDNFNSKKCKIILKKINDGIYKITSETRESDKFNEIIPETPLTTVKPLIRNGILTTTSTKIVENSSGENSILNLCDRYQYLTQNREKITKSLLDDNNISSKHKKISFEEKQPKVDQTTEKELISSRMDRTIETIISHEESEIKPGTPISLYRKTRSRKLFTKSKTVENFTSEDEVINSNEGISYTKAPKLKSIENRKRQGNSLFNNNIFPNKQKKLMSIPQCNENIVGSNGFNQIKLADNLTNNKGNSQILSEISNISLLDNNKTNKLRNSNLNINIPKVPKTVSFYNKTKMVTIASAKPSVGTKMSSVENDCSVIEISFDKDEAMNSSPNIIKRSTKSNSRINYSSTARIQPIQEESIIYVDKEVENLTENVLNTTEKLILPPGKWRRTLINWKKNQSVVELDESQIPVVLSKNTTINLEKTITDNKYKLMPKISSSYKQNTIISDQLIDKELKTQIFPVQRILRNNERKTSLDSSLIIIPENPEAECKIIEKRQTGVRKTLLLEPTDDGTPNFTTCSLFNTFTKPKVAAETIFVSNRQHTKNSKRFIEIEEEDFNDLQQKDDQQLQQQNQKQYHHREEGYSDERRCNSTITNNTKNSNNNKQKYQHQISVPICGTTKQSSILSTTIQRGRRGRTSIIETTNNIGFEQLSSSSAFSGSGDYHHHHHSSNREFIHSLLLNDDEQNILLCPSLNVSIRALLSPRDIVLRRCGQTDPHDFSIIYSETELRQCRKIGEGVYGEVYMNKNRNGEAIVLKIIPIDGQIEINGEQQKNFEQILPEIIIAAELSRLRNDKNFMTSGFVEVKNVHCVQGRYPQHLIDLWELYRDNCGTENDHPEIFQDDQLFIVLELANGGQDLEAFQFQNGLQSNSAFFQTALSLAVAERKFKFEHRDLHWGNILLAPTDEKEINFKFNDKIISIPTHGVKATIIDYTLSRMNFEGCCLYNDLSNDNELFTASGDYQFDIYRVMQKNLENQWERYDPYTNILWLHYAIDKMISGARYRSSKTKKHRSAIQDMMVLRDELLDYKSASDYVECLDLYIKKNY